MKRHLVPLSAALAAALCTLSPRAPGVDAAPGIRKSHANPAPVTPVPRPAAGPWLPAPIPLPPDARLAVGATFTGTYRALNSGATRKLSLRPQMTLFSGDPEAADRDTFAFVQLPDDPAWSFFCPVNEKFSLDLAVEDDGRRLGMVLVRALRDGIPGEVIGRVRADAAGQGIRGRLPIDPNVPNYQLTLLTRDARPLAGIIAEVPRSVRLRVLEFRYGFQPLRPRRERSPLLCEAPEENEYGDPKSITGRALLPAPVTVRGTVTRLFQRGGGGFEQIPPPVRFAAEETIATTSSAWNRRAESGLWGPYLAEMQASLPEFFTDDRRDAGGPGVLSPLTTAEVEGEARWEVDLSGQARALLAIPEERVRYVADWERQIRSLAAEADGRPRRAEAMADLLNTRLGKEHGTGLRRLHPGDIVPLGEAWNLRAAQAAPPRFVATR